MSLSETCIEQRHKEEQKVKLWIIGGLMASAVIHGGLFAFSFSGFLDRELEIVEEDAIEFIVVEEEVVEEEVVEEEEVEPEPEEVVEEPEEVVEEIPEEIVEEPEEVVEEIVEELASVDPLVEQPETESLQPAPADLQSLPEPEPAPVAEQPPPEPAPIAPPEPEPLAEEPPPEPAPAPEPAPEPLGAMSEEPLSEPEPLADNPPPEPVADSAPPEPLASADIAPDAPLTSPLGELEVEPGAANTPTETPTANDTAPLGAAAERSQPSQGAVPQPGTGGSPSGLEGSFAGIGSGESPTGGQTPGTGDQAFGGSPLDGRGGEAPGRPDGVEGGTGNSAGNETDTAYGGGGRLSCVDNCVPRYPNSLRDQGVEGTAIVRGLVGTDGRVAQLEIVQSSGNTDLDEAAIEAASRMRFLPPDGGASRPVRLPIQFTLN